MAFLHSLLNPRTVDRYNRALDRFRKHQEARLPDFWTQDEETQDFFLAAYVLRLMDQGLGRQAALDAVASVQKVFAGRRHFKACVAATEGWASLVPPVQAIPLPQPVACAMAVMLAAAGEAAAGARILLGFCGLLRVGEILQLRLQDVLFPTFRGMGPHVLLLLRTTKRGIPDSNKIIIDSVRVVAFLEAYARLTAGRERTEPFIPLSYNRFRSALARAAQALGLQSSTFRTHSLPRGGATALALSNMSFKDIMVQGRWASERSCRLCIMKGEIHVLRLRESIDSAQWLRILAVASIGEQVCGGL